MLMYLFSHRLCLCQDRATVQLRPIFFKEKKILVVLIYAGGLHRVSKKSGAKNEPSRHSEMLLLK